MNTWVIFFVKQSYNFSLSKNHCTVNRLQKNVSFETVYFSSQPDMLNSSFAVVSLLTTGFIALAPLRAYTTSMLKIVNLIEMIFSLLVFQFCKKVHNGKKTTTWRNKTIYAPQNNWT